MLNILENVHSVGGNSSTSTPNTVLTWNQKYKNNSNRVALNPGLKGGGNLRRGVVVVVVGGVFMGYFPSFKVLSNNIIEMGITTVLACVVLAVAVM